MVGVMNWILSIAWKAALLTIGWICVKYVLRNGGATARQVIETIGLAIRAGCYEVRYKLVDRLQRKAAEKEKERVEGGNQPDEEPSDDGECRVWGTVR